MEQNQNKKAIIYCRVSTKEQVEGTSLDAQDSICRKYAERSGFEILKLFREEGESAKTADRTQLLKMMDFALKNYKEINSLIIYKVDRLARNAADYADIKRYFSKLNIRVYSATENIDNTPWGRFAETMLAGWSQFDNEVRAERSRNGMIGAIKEGR